MKSINLELFNVFATWIVAGLIVNGVLCAVLRAHGLDIKREQSGSSRFSLPFGLFFLSDRVVSSCDRMQQYIDNFELPIERRDLNRRPFARGIPPSGRNFEAAISDTTHSMV